MRRRRHVLWARSRRTRGTPASRGPRWAALCLPLAALALGCDLPGGDELPAREAEPHRPVHVDSLFPIDEELGRFRAGLDTLDALQAGSAPSREALVDRFISALEEADTAGVASLAMMRAEFAWLYYPHTMYTEGPYELPPALVWYQQQNRSSRGLSRLLARYAGRTLHHTGWRCPDEGEPFGEGWIWHGCTVLGELPSGESVEERLFGSILEWRGRYKLVSFSNEL